MFWIFNLLSQNGITMSNTSSYIFIGIEIIPIKHNKSIMKKPLAQFQRCSCPILYLLFNISYFHSFELIADMFLDLLPLVANHNKNFINYTNKLLKVMFNERFVCYLKKRFRSCQCQGITSCSIS